MNAIILIHGFLTNEDDFEPIVPILKEKYDLVEIVKIPGHTKPPKYRYFNVEATFNAVLNTYDKVSITCNNIDVMGFSMGGALATYLQSQRKIRKMVLLAPANKFLNFMLIRNRSRYIVKNRRRIHLRESVEESKDNLNRLHIDDMKAIKIGMTELFIHYNHHTLSTFVKIIKKCNAELVSINIPTLMIWGKLDQFVPYTSIEYINAHILTTNKKIIVKEDISHLMLRSEKKVEIINNIIDFLDEKTEE